jgi:nucleoside 2-deoxyribosyltransferase
MKIYLAGPIQNCSDAEANDWRNQIIDSFPQHNFFNPMDRDYRGEELENSHALVALDKSDIDTCDLVIANCPRASYGTAMEILYAHSRNIPVWVATQRLSPWLIVHSHKIFQSLEHLTQELFRHG